MPPLTKPWKETLREQIQESSVFRRALLKEAMNCFLSGDPKEVDTAKTILHDFVEGTVGFCDLGKLLNSSPEVLRSFLAPDGDPSLKRFLEIVAYLQKQEGTTFELVDHDAA